MTTPRTHEGRVLPKQDEELVDQGLQFDIGTLLSRRRTLAFLGGGAAGNGAGVVGAAMLAPVPSPG